MNMFIQGILVSMGAFYLIWSICSIVTIVKEKKKHYKGWDIMFISKDYAFYWWNLTIFLVYILAAFVILAISAFTYVGICTVFK